jgi:ATP-dependent Clp protease ATP-binding subunit ClpC
LVPSSDRLRPVLTLAREEARALHHSYIGTEHILLGLLRDRDSVAARALESLGVTYPIVRLAVVRMMGTGVEVDPGALAFTGPSERAIARAEGEASDRGVSPVDTGHLLVALVSEREGAASRILLQLDTDPQAIRAAIDALAP